MPLHRATAKIPFTKEAYQQMRQRRADLFQLRTQVMARLQDSREQGDLSENGAYKYAKFELGNIRRELAQLHHLLENGEISQPIHSDGRVEFGRSVTVESASGVMTFTLVSRHESNPAANKLSADSPLGSAVNGKKIGDQVEAITPKGVVRYKIVNVS